MPPYNWQVNPLTIIQQFEARRNSPTAGALFAWAVSAVEAIHYLDDIDRDFENSRVSSAGHSHDVIDVAHARWATGTSITAVDLCAAGLGRAFCAQSGNHELDIGDFDSRFKANAQHRAQLPPTALPWVDSVTTDSQYNTVKLARDWMTHSRTTRHFSLSVGGLPQRQRLALGINYTQLPVRDLIQLARDFASLHVSAFVQLLPQL